MAFKYDNLVKMWRDYPFLQLRFIIQYKEWMANNLI
jgi:hypothetical protein